jgi:hypothetical protein
MTENSVHLFLKLARMRTISSHFMNNFPCKDYVNNYPMINTRGSHDTPKHRVIMYNIETKATSRLICFGHLSFECLLVVCTAAVGSK